MPTDSLRMARIHPGHNGPPPLSNVIPEPAQNRVKVPNSNLAWIVFNLVFLSFNCQQEKSIMANQYRIINNHVHIEYMTCSSAEINMYRWTFFLSVPIFRAVWFYVTLPRWSLLKLCWLLDPTVLKLINYWFFFKIFSMKPQTLSKRDSVILYKSS